MSFLSSQLLIFLQRGSDREEAPERAANLYSWSRKAPGGIDTDQEEKRDLNEPHVPLTSSSSWDPLESTQPFFSVFAFLCVIS